MLLLSIAQEFPLLVVSGIARLGFSYLEDCPPGPLLTINPFRSSHKSLLSEDTATVFLSLLFALKVEVLASLPFFLR